jgi:ATP-dependent Lon protease
MMSRHEPARAAADETGSSPAASMPPDGLIILPVRDTVLLPGTVFPISIGRERSIAAAQQAVREELQIGVLMQRDAKVAEPTAWARSPISCAT